MKRDPDLIRKLMLKLESLPMPAGSIFMINTNKDLQIDDYSANEVYYHMDQILMSGWVDGAGGHGMNPSSQFSFRALTPAGHDFVDSVRDEKIWKLTKDGVTKVGGFTLETLSILGKAFLKKQLEKHIGFGL
jgi:hypothetical protein